MSRTRFGAVWVVRIPCAVRPSTDTSAFMANMAEASRFWLL